MSERAQALTVGQLIAHLQAFPAETPVLVDGYEGGFDYPFPPQLLEVVPDWEDTLHYSGRFSEGYLADDRALSVVVLPRSALAPR